MANDIEQTENTYKLNDSNKDLIKTCKAIHELLRLALLKHLLVIIIVNWVIIFNMLQKTLQ